MAPLPPRLHPAAPKLSVTLLVLVSLLTGCTQPPLSAATHDYNATVATAWFDLILNLVRDTPGFTPPVASRAIGYAGVTLYEAVVPGMPEYQSLAGKLNQLTPLPSPNAGEEYHWPSVANSALARIARSLFAHAPAESLAAIDALEAKLAAEFQSKIAAAVFNRSAEQGRKVADAIFEWSRSDGGHEGYLKNFPEDYAPATGPGNWIPTPPKFSSPLQPYWGRNRTFALASNAECQPAPPPTYSEDPSSEFYKQAREVYDTVRNLTPEQRDIALFWADDPGRTPTPPGHSISIVNQVIRQKGAALDVAAEAYAKVGIAVADAFISCWHTKFRYNVLRPITYIQQVIDPAWNATDITDPVVTPPFPEYPSGHSVQSGASMQVLTDLFGDNFAFTDNTGTALGLASRSFKSFFDAANEAAVSRLYGGIHFRAAIEVGLTQGKCIGQKVSALKFRK